MTSMFFETHNIKKSLVLLKFTMPCLWRRYGGAYEEDILKANNYQHPVVVK